MQSSFPMRVLLACMLLLGASVFAFAQNPQFEMTQVGPNNLVQSPFDLNLAPDGYLWVTERTRGVVVRINPETGERDEMLTIAKVSSTSSQDGLLGIAAHPQLLAGQPYVYLSYTYLIGSERNQRLVRYTYSETDGDASLADRIVLVDFLPSSNDHNSGRLIIGPDEKLYYSIGDQGNNQNRNYCEPILSQVLPTQAEIDSSNYTNYPGKVLRLNLDGSIPEDNPVFGGVRSHIYSIGHRNPQGLVFSESGILYSDEHGPNTDDEVNFISAGKNYGWPRVAGLLDDQAYDYCNWSTLDDCAAVDYKNGVCPPGATSQEESSFTDTTYRNPLLAMFAVTDDYDFNSSRCDGTYFCRPNVAPSSIEIYESDSIPGWQNSLLVVSLKRGRIYRLKLSDDGQSIVGDTTQHFYTSNRYRDMVAAPDGKTFYVLTDETGRVSTLAGTEISTRGLQNPSTILKFTLKETSSVADLAATDVFRVWPNPATTSLTIEVKEAVLGTAVSAELITPTGQVSKQIGGLQAGNNLVSLDGLAAGIYFLKLSTGGASWQQRVVVR